MSLPSLIRGLARADFRRLASGTRACVERCSEKVHLGTVSLSQWAYRCRLSLLHTMITPVSLHGAVNVFALKQVKCKLYFIVLLVA